MFVVYLFVCATLLYLIKYHWGRRHIYRVANSMPGPPAIPIIGNALSFLCKNEDILSVITNMSAGYSKPARFWFGPVLVIYFSHPQHIEKILSSSKLAHKHDVYRFTKIYLGNGLVSNSGEDYKRHRRLIQPLFNLKFASRSVENFQKHINIFIKKLEYHVGKDIFDIHDYIHLCFADITGASDEVGATLRFLSNITRFKLKKAFCHVDLLLNISFGTFLFVSMLPESILGTQIGAQHGKNADYIKATIDMYNVAYLRMIRPWLHSDLIYNLTSAKKDQDHITEVTAQFIRDVIKNTWARTKSRTGSFQNPLKPIIDQIAEIIGNDPSCINDTDFLYHMYTLYCASEDTMTIIASVLCVCLGMYPEYQRTAAEEIRSVLGETPRDIMYEDIEKLRYLDMCIRDVLRLIPIAPIILRKTIDDFRIDSLTVPKGCGIVVSIFEVHRDPNHWENPNHFYPDHFLPEAVRRRHPFAFIPFSAGPRSCIGKLLAFVGLKLVMANILQRFEIEAEGKFPDLVLKTDITVRSLSGYKVRLKTREWK